MQKVKQLLTYFSFLGIIIVGQIIGASSAQAAAPNISISSNQDPNLARLLPNYVMNHDRKNHLVTFKKADGSAKLTVQVRTSLPYLSTTKEYAQYVMDSFAGWGLEAHVARRGFTFKYVDNAPCVGLVSYFDGTSYLTFGACGVVSKDEIIKSFTLAKKQLGLDNQLYRSASPALYY